MSADTEKLIERLAKWSDPAEYERVMCHWDKWRKYIKEGGGASWPRDAFESLLDAFSQDAKEAADRIASMEAERDDARQQRNEIGRAWDEADARAKEAEARASSLEKALAEMQAIIRHGDGDTSDRLYACEEVIHIAQGIRALSSSKQKP